MKKAVFFDRDGIINIDKGYVYSPSEFEFVSGIFELFTYFRSQGYLLLVVTNQSGIARGYYSTQDFLNLTEYMQNEIKQHCGFMLDKIYFCPHLEGCNCRKPKIGMFEEANKDFGIDFQNSIMIGDKDTDILAAHNAHIGSKFFLSLKSPHNLEHIPNLKWVVALWQIQDFINKEKQ